MNTRVHRVAAGLASLLVTAVSDPTQLEKGVDLAFPGLNAGREKASNRRVKVSSQRPSPLAIDLEGTF